jgi:uncharacterized protein
MMMIKKEIGSLEHLPQSKQRELKRVVEIVKESDAPVDVIVLFGSYARGGWVEDSYIEGGTRYEYISDFDLLFVVSDKKKERNHGLWNAIEKKVADDKTISTPVSIIVETIDHINKQLSVGQYFYTDIIKEGVTLYSSGESQFVKARDLSPNERLRLRTEDYNMWFERAGDMMRRYETSREMVREGERWNNIAAFDLHQSAEALYIAFLLVRTGYRPKTHDLAKMRARICQLDRDIALALPLKTDEDKKIFDLLRRGYVDARYRRDYRITADELSAISDRIKKLRRLVEVRCEDALRTLAEKAQKNGSNVLFPK